MCQATHAAVDWCMKFQEEAALWHESNYLVILAVKDEPQLLYVADRLRDLAHVLVQEPDLDDQHTAIAVEPDASRRLASLPLAFSGKEAL